MAVPLVASFVARAGGIGGIGAAVLRRLGRPDTGLAGNVGIQLRSNVRGVGINVERLLREHDKVTALALNKAARSARTGTRRELAKQKGIPQKVLRNRVKDYKASAKKKPIRSSLWVGTGKPIRAGELRGQVSLTASGTVKIGRRTFRGAFPATMPGGHRGIFTRKPGARHKKRADGQNSQLPIEESVVQLQPEAERISRSMADKALREVYPKEARRLMELRQERWKL